MSDEEEEKLKLGKIGPLVTYIVSGLVAAAALAGASYLARAGLELATATTTPTLTQDHALAILGLSVLAALAAAIVCGARALEIARTLNFLGFEPKAPVRSSSDGRSSSRHLRSPSVRFGNGR